MPESNGGKFRKKLYNEVTLVIAIGAAILWLMTTFLSPANTNAGNIKETQRDIEQIQNSVSENEMDISSINSDVAEIKGSVIRIETILEERL